MTVLRDWARSAAIGLMSLSAVNISAAFTGVSLGFSWLSGGAALIMGVPGVLLLLVVNALFLV